MTKRRGKGEGSIRQRPDGRWEARVDLGYEDGTRKQKSVYGKTRGEVVTKLRGVQRQLDDNLPVTSDRLTVEKFLQRWLDDVVTPRLAPKTVRSYKDTVRLHITPNIGRKSLAKLQPADVQKLMRQKQDAGLSPRSVAYIRTVLRIALNQALRWGLVHRNVAALVEPPRQVKHERTVFTPTEARRFLSVVEGDRLAGLYMVALALGLRQGEALGLRWQDVDLDARQLYVRVALQRIDGKLQLKEPKTEASQRTISLPDACVQALRAHRLRQIEDQLAAGAEWSNAYGLVFTTRDGTPLDPGNVYKRFKKLLRAAGLPDQRFHDLRHCCATLLIAQGVPVRFVMDLLGHTQMATTTDLYAHVLPAARADTAELMDVILGTQPVAAGL